MSYDKRDKGDDCGSTVDLEITESAVEDDDLMEDQCRVDNEESCTAERVRWKKKKNARMRMLRSSGWRREEGVYLRSDNVNIDSMKWTHYQSGKRSRGRSRPSLI